MRNSKSNFWVKHDRLNPSKTELNWNTFNFQFHPEKQVLLNWLHSDISLTWVPFLQINSI